MSENVKHIHLFQFEAYPEFSDGRTSRLKGFASFFAENNYVVNVHSLGIRTEKYSDNSINYFKYKFPGFKLASTSSITSTGLRIRVFSYIAKIISKLLIPDRYILALLILTRKMRIHVESGHTLLITVPWFSALLIGYAITFRRPRIALIIDYRDLWSDNKIFSSTRFSNGVAKIVQHLVLKRANIITATTESALGRLKKYNSSAMFAVVQNGITAQEREKISNINAACLIDLDGVTYFGNMGNKRDCVDLLTSLSENDIEFRLFGNLDSKHLFHFENSYKGVLNKLDAIKMTARCQYVLVAIRKAENSEYAIPGKIYELIALRRPILIYCPQEALALNFLKQASYPHFHIDSENTTNLNVKVVEFKNILVSNVYIKEDSVYDIPTREEEIEKLNILIDRVVDGR